MTDRINDHPFERAGLGKAPFFFTHEVTRPRPGAAAKCDHCGKRINKEFWVQSSDDKVFKVGLTCVSWANDAAMAREFAKSV
jgi:hypothetical protein